VVSRFLFVRSNEAALAKAAHGAQIKQRSSVMSALLTLIYQEFCKARLAEMRKQRLVGY
jgi:hypothetical protein